MMLTSAYTGGAGQEDSPKHSRYPHGQVTKQTHPGNTSADAGDGRPSESGPLPGGLNA